MTHADLHKAIGELLYIEDFGMYDILMASIVANSLQLGDPVWLTLIGASSAGKSQIIRPFALGNPDIIHRIDDLTANTMISGSLGLEHSLLGRIEDFGILSMDDLTVLFSKNTEARAEILSQFRMLYDGRFSKSSGNKKEEMVWEGYLGMIAGSTPSIYRFFNEVADMGERFIAYRMRPYDKEKALEFITKHQYKAKEVDDKLAAVIQEFVQGVVADIDPGLLELSPSVMDEIREFSSHCTLLRTPVHVDERTGLVDEFPEPEMPLRVMKQLVPMAKALQVVQGKPLDEESIEPLLWVAYSLSNDKRRSYLKAVVELDHASEQITSRTVSRKTGLHSEVVRRGLDQLQALHIVELEDETGTEKVWSFQHTGLRRIVRRLEKI